jgi:ABC-2 type transport system permease protein
VTSLTAAPGPDTPAADTPAADTPTADTYGAASQAAAQRLDPRVPLIALQTIVRKEIHRFLRIWVQTLLPPAITTSLYFIIFGNLIGTRLGGIHGVTYMQYIAPGLIMMSIITQSFANVVSSFYGAKFQKHIEEQLVAPIPIWTLLLGYVFGGLARGLCVGTVVTGIALGFTDLTIHSFPTVVAVVVLTALIFSLGGLINAIYAKSFDDISIFPTFILTPLTYLGGVFYSIDLLPEFWRTLSLANPILYMVGAFRYGILGIADVSMTTAFAVIGALLVGLYGLAYHLLEKGVGLRS